MISMKYLLKITAMVLFCWLSSLHTQGQSVPASGKILAAAYQKATKEKKKVFLMFHASWCGWCHKMDDAMNDPSCKQLFEGHYVIAHLDIDETGEQKKLENKGAELVRKRYHGEKAGLPFWLVLDKNGKLLGDSFIRKEGQSLDTPGENIGCPAEENEIAAFIQVLKQTSSLNDDELQIIAERFRKIK
jgi:thioredoxin-related protein